MRLKQFLQKICDSHGVTMEQITGTSRNRELFLIRKQFAEIAYKDGFSASEIGRALNRCHTTVCYYLNRRKKPTPPPQVYPTKEQWNIDPKYT